MLQAVAITVSCAVTLVGLALFGRAVTRIVRVVRLGGPAHRRDRPAARTATMLRETLLHDRMLQWTWVGAAHWFLMIGFGLLFATLVNAFGQLVDPHFMLPVIGHFPPFEWLTELFAWAMVLAVVPLIAYRATRPRGRVPGVHGRFYGSTMWQGYFVELVILGVGLCIIALRFLEFALAAAAGRAEDATLLHFPLTAWGGRLLTGVPLDTLETAVILVATAKILISFAWMITISLQPTMGVAWHRFLAFPNIWAKREADGGVALGAVKPLEVDGKPFDLELVEDLDEDAALGVGKIEDFSWKGLLDLSTCTECGRCQSQCPPGVEHREAALPQAPGPEPPRPRPRQGAVPALGRGPARFAAPRSPRRGRPGAGRADRGGPLAAERRRRDRSRRPVVLHDVRGMRPAVPGRHRARGPRGRHAPLPGPRRVELPRGADRALQGAGEQGQPVEHEPVLPDGLGQGTAVRGQAGRGWPSR